MEAQGSWQKLAMLLNTRDLALQSLLPSGKADHTARNKSVGQGRYPPCKLKGSHMTKNQNDSVPGRESGGGSSNSAFQPIK